MASPMKATLTGLTRVRQQIEGVARAYPDRVATALRAETEIELTESKRRCPVDVTPPTPHPGQLRNSGRVLPIKREGRRLTATIAYGTEYAVYVHEDLDALHPVGEAKFLERPLKESAPFIPRRVAERLK